MKRNQAQMTTKHLKPQTRRWFRDVTGRWILEQHHERILLNACEAWDRGEEARLIVDREGQTYNDRFGQPKLRPEVLVERDCKALFAKLVRELDLDLEAPKEAGSRPPALRSIRGGK
jgi:hypothetical protein